MLVCPLVAGGVNCIKLNKMTCRWADQLRQSVHNTKLQKHPHENSWIRQKCRAIMSRKDGLKGVKILIHACFCLGSPNVYACGTPGFDQSRVSVLAEQPMMLSCLIRSTAKCCLHKRCTSRRGGECASWCKQCSFQNIQKKLLQCFMR